MAEKLIWRYATVIGRNEVEIRDLLNQAGYDGWELVSVNCLAGMEGVRWIAFVKLPVRIPDLAAPPMAMAAPMAPQMAPMAAAPVAAPAAPIAAAPSRPAAPAPAANLDDFASMKEESTAKSAAAKPVSPEPEEIHGVDFDFGGSVAAPVVEIPQTQDVTSASGPEFDLGNNAKPQKDDLFHLGPEQQAILTGGSLMSLDDFPVEFSMSAEKKTEKKSGDNRSGTMMSLDDFPEMPGTDDGEKPNNG